MTLRYRKREQQNLDRLLVGFFSHRPPWMGPAVGAALALLLEALTRQPIVAVLGAAIVLLFWLAGMVERRRRRRLLARAHNLHDLRQLTWQQFEALVAEAYRQRGWKVTETGGGGPDGGIDLVLRRGGDVVGVQCKRWRNFEVRPETVRALQGALADFNATRGIFVTTGYFSAEARAYGQRRGMELIDGDSILGLIPFAKPESAAGREGLPRLCPLCHSAMVRRTSRHGGFWGCSRYPACRGKRPVA